MRTNAGTNFAPDREPEASLRARVRVRLQISDETVAPNHGWRHRFRTEGRRAKMLWQVLDANTPPAPDYGEVTVNLMYSELLK
jgi:hypothetical protein